MVIAADPVPDGARGLRAPIRKQDRGNPFAAAGTTTLTTSDVFDYALARHRQDQWRRRHRWSVVRVFDQVADRVGRDRRHGAIIWRLKTPAADAMSAPSD